MALPTLFVSHGAPTFALKPGAAGAALVELAKKIETPRAIVVISPHWETREPCVGSAENLETIYDFAGFPQELYTLTYPAHGNLLLAEQVAGCLKHAGYPVRIDTNRGLDHGAWVPLRMMYPQANIPVIPLSIKPYAGAAYHYELGQALAPLTNDGFLIIGTGSITHNLRDYMICAQFHEPTPSYVSEFSDWIEVQLKTNDIQSLINYRNCAPNSTRAHPSEDHFMPFFVAMGAAGSQPQFIRFYKGIDDHVIAMDGYQFEQAVQ